jgi:hypothetical protein
VLAVDKDNRRDALEMKQRNSTINFNPNPNPDVAPYFSNNARLLFRKISYPQSRTQQHSGSTLKHGSKKRYSFRNQRLHLHPVFTTLSGKPRAT